MTDKQDPTAETDVTEVPREEWPAWCASATAEYGGREVILHQADRALGEVRLAAGQHLVSFEHDRFGKTEALTVKCGSTAVPVSYVVAEPRTIRQHRDAAGDVDEFSIIDATGRRTVVRLA